MKLGERNLSTLAMNEFDLVTRVYCHFRDFAFEIPSFIAKTGRYSVKIVPNLGAQTNLKSL